MIRILEVSIIMCLVICHESNMNNLIGYICCIYLIITSPALFNYCKNGIYSAGYSLSWAGFWTIGLSVAHNGGIYLFGSSITKDPTFVKFLLIFIFSKFYCVVNYLWHSKRIIINQTTNGK